MLDRFSSSAPFRVLYYTATVPQFLLEFHWKFLLFARNLSWFSCPHLEPQNRRPIAGIAKNHPPDFAAAKCWLNSDSKLRSQVDTKLWCSEVIWRSAQLRVCCCLSWNCKLAPSAPNCAGLKDDAETGSRTNGKKYEQLCWPAKGGNAKKSKTNQNEFVGFGLDKGTSYYHQLTVLKCCPRFIWRPISQWGN